MGQDVIARCHIADPHTRLKAFGNDTSLELRRPPPLAAPPGFDNLTPPHETIATVRHAQPPSAQADLLAGAAGVSVSLEEAGDRLFTFTRLDPSQWKSARTTNAIERLNEEFRRRIKTQTVLPCAETVPMLLWALLASGQIQMRKIDGWETLSQPIEPMPLDLAA